MAEFFRRKKKICQMCAGKSVKYSDVPIISKYINEKGKILPRRMTGACALHQRIENILQHQCSLLSSFQFYLSCEQAPTKGSQKVLHCMLHE